MSRWTARLGLAGVTILAAWASYLHALVVVQAADGRTLVAKFIPALADLLIATASANLLDASRSGQRWPRLSVAAISVAVVVTLGMNVAAGSPAAIPPWCVNIWPPVAFILALESFLGHVRRGRGNVLESYDSASASHGEPADEPDIEADMAWLLSRHSQRSVERVTGASRYRLAKLAAPAVEVAALNGASDA